MAYDINCRELAIPLHHNAVIDFRITQHQTKSASETEMTSLAIFLASCWVLGGATITQDGQLYSNIGINDVMFTDNITIESTATSAGQCAQQCNQQDSCVTFTFNQSTFTCRGHGVRFSSYSATQSGDGARSYTKRNNDPVVRCDGTGVKRLKNTSLGLDVDIYCDAGWLVFQKRQDGSVNFYRNGKDYNRGFGYANGEYWLGLDPLHRITTSGVSYELRVDLMKFDGTKASVSYSDFTVGPAVENYKMNFGTFLGGSTGNDLSVHKGMQFSTLDADRDVSSYHCSGNHNRGGWWYWDCMNANPNGRYKHSRIKGVDGIVWKSFDGLHSLKSCQMMIRPVMN